MSASQLAPKLAADTRVVLLEGINARHLQMADIRPASGRPCHRSGRRRCIVASAGTGAAGSHPLLRPGGVLLSLVKPQFEVGRDGLSKTRHRQDERLYLQVERKIRDLCAGLGLQVNDFSTARSGASSSYGGIAPTPTE